MSPRHTHTPTGLDDPRFEHDACGVALVADAHGHAAHAIVARGLEALGNLAHRGAAGADAESGDGAGMLLQLPHQLLDGATTFDLPPPGGYGVGMVFLPTEREARRTAEALVRCACDDTGTRVLGWRDVPVESSAIGPVARAAQPHVAQVFVEAPGIEGAALERHLYRLRRVLEKHAASLEEPHRPYVCSLSGRTVVYKGMLLAEQLAAFYPELGDAATRSAHVVVHARFSTNTLPRWSLAQPLRMLAHNGEINTVRGNALWMRAREGAMASPLLGGMPPELVPVVSPTGSDSAQLDNAVELLSMAGRDVEHVITMLVPGAETEADAADAERHAFHAYHGTLTEAWDGPAALAFSDGLVVGAALDRNGLRPARTLVTADGLVVVASEAGVVSVDPASIVHSGRLRPGTMVLVDPARGGVLHDAAIKDALARERPYSDWLAQRVLTVRSLPALRTEELPLRTQQVLHGWTDEDLRLLVGPTGAAGDEPVGSMGNDAPPAVLSDRAVPLFAYFKQLFAQVTNPPIDPIREREVMSLEVLLGPTGNILDRDTPQPARVSLPSPLLDEGMLAGLAGAPPPAPRVVTLDAVFEAGGGATACESALVALGAAALAAVRAGAGILVLSDRAAGALLAPIPSLLATSAVHHHLVDAGVRGETGLVVDSAEPREIMHLAALVGHGADAVCPRLALQTLDSLARRGALGDISTAAARANLRKAMDKSMLKTMARMGISTVRSYCGAQLFEAVGLDASVVDRWFPGTPSRIGGVSLEVVVAETLAHHARAFPSGQPELVTGGLYQWRRDGEHHQWNPETIGHLQHAVKTGDAAHYATYAAAVNQDGTRRRLLRGLLEPQAFGPPVPLDEVEPAASIVRRFASGAMSFGSISREAHETIAIGMNRIGARSNTGEGGEDGDRYQRDANGDLRRSAVKQVASARFGVTAHYLVNADDLQIKIAQGAKPGEGGQLPGHKVDETIARTRHSTPGVGLISPPPHHDIYSIEDLAQLIHDLRMVNPSARMSVKLVAEAGVGTVAAGVSKAGADHIVISGYEGGTGASPLSSIRHAGVPWEIGLAEAQQVLVRNGLRGRVVLQADGQMKTGRDVIVAALLGAEEFGFATAVLVATGCVMMRVCHLNTCPVGIATQDPRLRARYGGNADQVVAFMHFLAEDVRQRMAALGVRHFDELVGRADRLAAQPALDHWKARGLDFTALLHRPAATATNALRHCKPQRPALDGALDHRIIAAAQPALERGEPVHIALPVVNADRTVGAMLSGEVARRHGAAGLPDGTVSVDLAGTAGQSLGAWLTRGITLTLQGQANDHVGKGLSGGRIVVRPHPGMRHPEEDVIIGNVALYGATAGELFVRGIAGERFAVRNSGAVAVVEGVGDHGCEYMTRGTVVVLGEVGRNFAAGMSGGIAYVLDENRTFTARCNLGDVDLEPLEEEADRASVEHLLSEHARLTGSLRARGLLEEWPVAAARFVKVMPRDLRRVLEAQRERELELAG